MNNFFVPASEQHIKKQREKAKQLRNSLWWKKKLNKGLCYYCEKQFDPEILSMDHLIPLVRGGHSDKNNVVAACKKCNSNKQNKTLVEFIDEKIKNRSDNIR